MNATLTPDLLHTMDAYWRAANYLSVGQMYLYDNPLQQRIVMKIHLADRQIVGGAPIGVHQVEQFRRERVGCHGSSFPN